MAERRHADDGTDEQSGAQMKRRGILAAAGVAVAGLMAKQTAAPVLAAGIILGGTGSTNTEATETGILHNGPASPAGPVLLAFRSPGAVTAVSAAINAGIIGETFVTDAPGVQGRSANGAQGKGIHGISNGGFGVYGEAFTGTGVAGTTGGVYGVYGTSSMAGGAGVRGDCTGGYGVIGSVSDGYGVLGQADTGNGLRGYSNQNHAIVGQTGRTYFGGVFGVATLDNTVGIYGSTKTATGYNANAFAGYMDGNFVVANGFKSAAVPHTDGSHRLVYCMESPENWFEDFGKAKLVNGKAEVTLDPDFAAIVQTDDYHVFLTPYDGVGALRVAKPGTSGFAVEAIDGTGSGMFGYRVVAKRKDLAAARLARFDLPGKTKHDVKPLVVPPRPPDAPKPAARTP